MLPDDERRRQDPASSDPGLWHRRDACSVRVYHGSRDPASLGQDLAAGNRNSRAPGRFDHVSRYLQYPGLADWSPGLDRVLNPALYDGHRPDPPQSRASKENSRGITGFYPDLDPTYKITKYCTISNVEICAIFFYALRGVGGISGIYISEKTFTRGG